MEYFPSTSPAGRKLAAWLRYSHEVAGIDFDTAVSRREARRPSTPDVGAWPSLPAPAWARLKAALRKAAGQATDDDVVSANVEALMRAVGLTDIEREIFRFVFQADRDGQFGGLCSDIVDTRAVDSAGLVGAPSGSRRRKSGGICRAGRWRASTSST